MAVTERRLEKYAWASAAFVLTFLAFLPALRAGFVNWDDDHNFLLNESYRGLSPAHLKWMATTFHMGPYQPLSWLTLGLDYTLWGMNPHGYHLTNLILHAANAGLMVFLSLALLKKAGIDAKLRGFAAFLAALLFAVHPLRVESVAWVTERRDVLSGFFFILALWAWVSEPRRPRLSFIAWILSLLAKATAVTAPILLLILDVFPLRRLPGDPRRWLLPRYRPVLLEKLPWFAVSIVFGVMALAGQKSSGSLETLGNFGPADRFGLVAYATGFYVLKTAIPLSLSPLYELKPEFHPLGALSILSALAITGITVALVVARRKSPAALAAWIAFLVLILPVAGVARAGHAVAADRYTYLASIPLALFFGSLAARPSPLRAGVFVAIVLALGVLTFRSTKVWNDSVSLWRQALTVDPGSDNAALSLGYALMEARRYPEAEVVYRDLLKRSPDLADARYNFGMLLYLDHRPGEAETEFARLTREAPGFADGHYGLGIVYMLENRPGPARAELQSALRLDPHHEKARQALAGLARMP